MVQIFLRKTISLIKKQLYSNIWPIDYTAKKKPDNWKGWPDNKKFAFIVSHDVEGIDGYKKVKNLVEVDKSFNLKSSINFVPLKYNIEKELIDFLISEGFEINPHGLYHDGKLFFSKRIFNNRVKKINYFINEWGSKGFFAPSTIRNFEWIHELNIEYDASTFDTDPFEPQPDGLKTIFPVIIYNKKRTHFYVEIPYTLPQDSTLFIIMKEKNIDIWKKKIDWLVENNGLIFLRTHPDYINFDNLTVNISEYPVKYYKEVLEYITTKYKDQFWHVLPKDLATFWKKNYL